MGKKTSIHLLLIAFSGVSLASLFECFTSLADEPEQKEEGGDMLPWKNVEQKDNRNM